MISKVKQNKLLMQIIKFIIVGGIATVIDYVIFFILHELLGSVKWVFEVDESKDKKQQFIIFIVFSILGLLINTGIVYLCTDIIKLYSLIGKVIATSIVMIFNFITRKIFLE